MKKIIIVLVLIFWSINSYAFLGIVTKDDVQLLKAKIDKIDINFNKALAEFTANIESKINVKMGLINKEVIKISNERNTVENSTTVIVVLIISNLIVFIMFIVALMRQKDYKRSYQDMKEVKGLNEQI